MASLLNLFRENVLSGVQGADLMQQHQQQLAEQSAHERAKRIDEAWEAYYGQHPQSLVVKNGEPDDNVVLNNPRLIVDKGVSFLFGKEVSIDISATDGDEADPEAASEDDPAQQALDDFWEDNGGMLWLQKLALEGGVSGHPFVELRPNEGDPRDAGQPRLKLLDSKNVEVVTDPDDHEIVDEYRITWVSADAQGRPMPKRKRVIANDDRRGWHIVVEVMRGGASGWQPTGEEFPWPWPFAPIFDCQNLPVPNEYYGCADLEPDLLSLCYATNRVVSAGNRIVRFQAGLKHYVTGQSGELDLPADPDAMVLIPNPDAKVGTFQVLSDLGPVNDLYDKLKGQLHEQSHVPEVTTGKLDKIGNLSGLALSILYGPIIDRTLQKQLTYGGLLRQLSEAALQLMRKAGPDVEIHIGWPDLLPDDEQAEAALLAIDQTLGVSKRTLMEKRGYDPDVEAQRKADEAADAPPSPAQQMLDGMTAFDQGGDIPGSPGAPPAQQ